MRVGEHISCSNPKEMQNSRYLFAKLEKGIKDNSFLLLFLKKYLPLYLINIQYFKITVQII